MIRMEINYLMINKLLNILCFSTLFILFSVITVSASSVWIDEADTGDLTSNFVMGNASYYGASKPVSVPVSGQSFDYAMKFWGKNGIAEYTGSKYVGRLFHEYLKHSTTYDKGDWLTFCFYARAESSCGNETLISVGIQTEDEVRSSGRISAYSNVFPLTTDWQHYSVTVEVPKKKEDNAAGFRPVLNLGYYGQTTYIADFRVYRSDAPEFSTQNTISNIKLTIDENETDSISEGEAKISAEFGAEVKNAGLLLALYNTDGCMEKIDISAPDRGGSVAATLRVEDADSRYLRGFVWNMDTLMPLDDTIQLCKAENESMFEIELKGGTDDYPLTCEIGEPAVITGEGFPDILLHIYETGYYDAFLITPDGNKLRILENCMLAKGGTKAFDVGEYTADAMQNGEYKFEVNCRTCYGISIKDSVYFRMSDNSEYTNEAVYMDGECLVYQKDYKGNCIPDYSNVGYRLGDEAIPDVANVITLYPSGSDDTASIQAAVDKLAVMPPDSNGFRGALFLKEGIWQVSDTIYITQSGIVIRGENYREAQTGVSPEPVGTVEEYSGKYTGGTVILATSKTPNSLLFHVKGKESARLSMTKVSDVVDWYVPAGSFALEVEDASKFNVGDEVIIKQTANDDWISAIGMDQIPQRPTPDANPSNPDNSTIQWTEHDCEWLFERRIVAIDGNNLTFDSPVVNAIEKRYGKVSVCTMKDMRISDIGIENIHAVALWSPNGNNVDDTRHAQRLIHIDNARDVFVRNITAEHFNVSCVTIEKGAKRVEVDTLYNLIADKKYYTGEGYDSTGRTFYETQVYVGRYGMNVFGQQNLMKHIYGINNRHLLEFMGLVEGPNVCYDCTSENYLAVTGPHCIWSTGGLFDNIRGSVAFQNRLWMGSGQGWSGAWYTAWNTDGVLTVQKPPMAQNYSVGHVGTVSDGDFPDNAKGSFTFAGQHHPIQSLYLYQSQQSSAQ